MTFKAYRIHEIDKKIVARFEQLTLDELAPGDVVIRVLYSDINYKDALAATGAGASTRSSVALIWQGWWSRLQIRAARAATTCS